MKKKSGIVNLILLTILMILGVVFCFVEFSIPFTTYKFVGFARALDVGQDLGEGITITLNARPFDGKDKTFDEDFEETYQFVYDMIRNRVNSSSVVSDGTSSIRVTLPYSYDNYDLLSAIGSSHELKFSTASDGRSPFMTGKNITDIYARRQNVNGQNRWGLVIAFDDEGKESFSSIAENVTLYVFLDDQQMFSVPMSGQITTNSIFLSGASNNETDTTRIACQLLTGKYLVDISSSAPSSISPEYGSNALFYVAIASIVALAIIIGLWSLFYRTQGLVASGALLTYISALLLVLALIPNVVLTLSSYVILVLNILVIVGLITIVLERIKDEYASGKKLNASYRSAFKKSLWTILDTTITLGAIGLVLLFLGKNELWVFGAITLPSMILGALTAIFLFRAYIANLVNIVKKSKGLGMVRKEGVDEIA